MAGTSAHALKMKYNSINRHTMKTKNVLCGLAMTVALQLGMLAGSAQTNKYLFSGSETNITLPPGTYIITAYGAQGGYGIVGGGLGAEMSAEFKFSASTTLTLLVGGGGRIDVIGAGGGGGGGGDGGNGNVSTNGGPTSHFPIVYGGTGGGGGGGYGYYDGGGGGGFLGNGGGGGFGEGSFENGGTGGAGYSGFYSGGFGGGGGGGYSGGGGSHGYHTGFYSGGSGGGGGSIIDSSAIANLAEVSGIASPDDPYAGEIIITAVPPPLAITADGANVILTWPAATIGYRVESATSLVPPVAWQTNSTPPIVIGGLDVIISPNSGSQQFYRLQQ
jgi:hypothetical protein